MTFSKLGGIYYTETYEIQRLDTGGSIPCFIGRTINPTNLEHETSEDNKGLLKASARTTAEEGRKINQLQKFSNFEQVNKEVSEGGLGLYDSNKPYENPLLKVIHDFCEETKLMTEEYVACPYFYVIDLGCADNINIWVQSIETSKLKREIDFEVYVGFDNVHDGTETVNSTVQPKEANLTSFILAVNYDIVVNRANIGDFRKAFYTISKQVEKTETENETQVTKSRYVDNTYLKENYRTIDTELTTLTNSIITNNDTKISNNAIDTSGTTNSLTKSRIYIVEPLWFGKTIGRICITPYDMEPGYYQYNTLTIDDIILRKPSEKLALQIGGVIFNQLEETSKEEYVKINRTQSVSSRLSNHPPDSLFQARNLVDELVVRLFDVVYPQIKNKETETNLAYLQTQVNKVVNDAINDGDFIPPYTVDNTNKGTFMSVQESSEDAYDLELVGMIQPVNCTYSIHIVAQINDAKVKVLSV